MAAQRKSIDCRDHPSDAAVQHAVSAHGHENSPELRDQIKSMLKNEAD